MYFIVFTSLTLLTLPGVLLKLTTDPAMSIAGMKYLVDMEGLFINELTHYTKELKDKIDTIESFLHDVQSKREISRKNPEEFVAHPLNGFSLIRRLHEDWTHIELFMAQGVGQESLKAIQKGLEEGRPTDQDLDDAIAGIRAMCRFYNLQPDDIARGIFLGQEYNASLTALNCLSLAKACINYEEGNDAINWYKTAVSQYDDDRDGQVYRDVFDFKLPDLYENYVSTLVSTGYRQAALSVIRDVSDLDATLWLLHKKVYDDAKIDIADPTFLGKPWVVGSRCQGKWDTKKYFSCHYESKTTDFLRLAPLKVEVLSLDPHIAIYHGVIYDSEISRVKNGSLASLKSPPRYINGDDYNLKFSRVIEDHNSTLNQRVKDITGEEVREDSDFVIYNYGIGGHRNIHMDNLQAIDQMAELGDRLTSVMFFLSEVNQGGAIVFPYANLTVWPQKGSALVWRNLNFKMQSNEGLVHLSCPVVVGSKWTLIKWLHERPQMFSRPCEKEYSGLQTHEKMI
ncbi:prolyl 4-hydroxylase subunit alpha-1 [Drosophila ficusphila]|uniref:prolyl 4-hydroxylase subunit alpha-1 n=1 Tax=Drosophila ficusphila TaxID=30025 RepID=UPI0007E636DD|nr:prolyl 4-hydroxylase subunit alpha-1 [Drosophila ficusphila]